MKRKLLLFTALISAAVLVSCEKQKPTPKPEPEPVNSELKGEVTKNLTLKSKGTYYLTGGLHVKAGATLTIEKGVTIIAKDDNIVDYILIEQGGKIMAAGTATEPIVMTSEKKEHGAWGGIHICGKAPINVQGVAKSEIGDALYGGTVVDDNSGVMKYVRVEYTGYAFSEEKESNGMTFYGVGNGTTLEYLQAYMGSDDGFEWFGGTVNVKYLVSKDNTDDSFDWTQGWNGKAQFLVAQQISAGCDCLIEADNNSKNNDLNPVSHPILSNITLIGNNSKENVRGIRLRAGTHVQIYNTLVTGKPSSITVETTQTENALKNGTSKLEYIYTSKGLSSKEKIYTEEQFVSNKNNAINQNINLSGIIGSIPGGKDMTKIDASFFIFTDYKGAIASADKDWTKGWTK